jgi:predicted NUDIX family phosphoesterase
VSEDVLVVARAHLFPALDAVPRGFLACDVGPWLARAGAHGRFVPRALAETDPTLKQIVPYAVVRAGSQVLLLRRRRGGSEKRLHDRWTIGVGGHVSADDRFLAGDPPEPDDHWRWRPLELVTRTLRREVGEEIAIDPGYTLRAAGVVNDDADAVGEVHFGVVFEIRAARATLAVRETDRLEGRFVQAAELRERVAALESWSRAVALALWPELEPSAADLRGS